jgi:hypothetical protein
MRRIQWAIVYPSTTIRCRDIRPNVKWRSILNIKNADVLTFGRISRHPMVVEGCTMAHWIRLIETNPMSRGTSFHSHWMPGYSAKRQMAQHFKYKKCRCYDVWPNISASDGRGRIHYSSLESSHQDESNELRYIFLWLLDAEIFGQTS